MSKQVFTDPVAELGEHHYGRKSDQPSRQELRSFYKRAEKQLAHPVLWWDDAERQALVEAFADAMREEQLTCYACAVLSNHAHLLIRKHRLDADGMVTLFKDVGRRAIHDRRLAPQDHPIFSADSCHIFKSDPRSVRTCICYIAENYAKHHLPPIPCDAVTPYNNWPYHERPPEQ